MRNLYEKEASIQSSIFYYNNSILNKVVDDMTFKPKKHENPLLRDDKAGEVIGKPPGVKPLAQ